MEHNQVIDIIIPCIPKHIKYLKNIIASINNNTQHPNNIIIALSESNYSKELKDNLQKLSKSIPIILNTTSSKSYAAENRNRAAGISNADILMFIDADDLMLPNLIEVVINTMKLHDADAVLHGFTRDIDYIEPESEITYKNVLDPISFAQLEKSDRDYIHLTKIEPHHGHITVKRDIYMKLGGQNENEKYTRGQDAKFVRDLFKNNYRVAYNPRKLTVYNEHLSAEPYVNFIASSKRFIEKYKYLVILVILVILLILLKKIE